MYLHTAFHVPVQVVAKHDFYENYIVHSMGTNSSKFNNSLESV